MEITLGKLQKSFDQVINKAADENLLQNIWAHDYTVWSDSPDEITNRLGWLHLPESMSPLINDINELVQSVQNDGYTHCLLLGMGGSSLAPEVFAKVLGVKPGFLELAVLDSTDPGAVLAYQAQFEPARTLYIVSTKSGGTVETLSFFKYFYNQVVETTGEEFAGQHFVAITDPGSKLEKLATEYEFRRTFLNDPNIGGRYSALSCFGLVPAALLGIEIDRLLTNAAELTASNSAATPPEQSPAIQLGVALGAAALAGCDKATFSFSPGLEPFGDWVEQLIAESLGKSGKGILPVVGEPLGSPDVYGPDRLFISLQYENAPIIPEEKALLEAGHPWVSLNLHNEYDLGGQFMLWEMATAVAGHVLGVHPFNQPDVESAKVEARNMVQAYSQQGKLPAGEYADFTFKNLQALLQKIQPGNYVSLQAYTRPTDEHTEILESLRLAIRDNFHIATTVGYGPRFLHSTGQLHKGDGGNGLFVQLITEPVEDAPIPTEAGQSASDISFGVLKQAQALGDAQALRSKDRRVISFLIPETRVDELKKWTEQINQ